MTDSDNQSDREPSYEYEDIDAPDDAPEPLHLALDKQSEELQQKRQKTDE